MARPLTPLLESPEDEDQTDESTEDLGILTSIFKDDECLGPKESDELAKRINEAFSKKLMESKFKALAETYCSPENCNLLRVPRVHSGIWNDLPRTSRKLDVGLQEAQKSAVHAAQAIILAAGSLIRCRKEETQLDNKVLLDYLYDSVFHRQCLFSSLTETQRAPEARFIKGSLTRLHLCLAFFLR